MRIVLSSFLEPGVKVVDKRNNLHGEKNVSPRSESGKKQLTSVTSDVLDCDIRRVASRKP